MLKYIFRRKINANISKKGLKSRSIIVGYENSYNLNFKCACLYQTKIRSGQPIDMI